MSKLDLTEVTFIIPCRVDTKDRLENLILLLKYITKYFITNIEIWEFSNKRKIYLSEEFQSIDTCIYKWVETKTEFFNKAKYINEMVSKTNTEYFCIQDVDVFLKPHQYAIAVKLLKEQAYDMVLPFNKFCFDIPRKYYNLMLKNLSLEQLPVEGIECVYEWCTGGCGFWNKKSFYSIGMMNENFNSLGGLDTELVLRAEILGLKLIEINDKLYHLVHCRLPESSLETKGTIYRKRNREERDTVRKMSKKELLNYVKGWGWVDKYKKKDINTVWNINPNQSFYKKEKKKLVFSMASIPSRKETLKRCLDSIIPNVDYGFLTLNNYSEVPDFLSKYKNLTVFRSQNIGDYKASAKFFPMILLKEPVYYFTCDDDLIFPNSYFKYMINKSKSLKGIVSQHGGRFTEFPMKKGFYGSITNQDTRFLSIRTKDTKVPFGGTGVMCIDTEYFKIDSLQMFLDYFKTGLLVDAWFGIRCCKNKISIYCVKNDAKVEFINYPLCMYNMCTQKKLLTPEIKKTIAFVSKEVNNVFSNR